MSTTLLAMLRRRFPLAEAIALVGSRGRGDAIEGSDYDVWVIGGVVARTHAFRFRGVPVTVFEEPWALVRQPSHQTRLEPGSVAVLWDRRGRFESLRWHPQATQKANLLNVEREIRALLRQATRASPFAAMVALRRAAMLGLARQTYLQRGVLAPKLRQVPAQLVAPYLRLAGLTPIRVPPRFPSAHAKYLAGHRDEARLQLREALWRQFGLERGAGPDWDLWRRSQGPTVSISALEARVRRWLRQLPPPMPPPMPLPTMSEPYPMPRARIGAGGGGGAPRRAGTVSKPSGTGKPRMR